MRFGEQGASCQFGAGRGLHEDSEQALDMHSPRLILGLRGHSCGLLWVGESSLQVIHVLEAVDEEHTVQVVQLVQKDLIIYIVLYIYHE